MTTSTIERQGARRLPATAAMIARELGRLKPQGPSSFAILSLSDALYYQAAGGGGGMILEKRTGETQWRAYQSHPVVPFEEGTELRFAGSQIRLQRDEWFRRDQVIDVWSRVVRGEPEPAWLQWRDITRLITGR